jgi:cytochrome c oxidase subunit 4
MSDEHGSTSGHGAHGGPDHVPHVTPMNVYLKTFGALVFLTLLTVGVSRVNLGHSTNLVIALLIATIKAATVAAMFMHLYTDHKFHTAIFASSLVFLLVFVTFTMFDTEFRGKFGQIDGQRVTNMQDPFNTLPPPAAPAASGSAAPAAPPAAPAPEKK